MADFLKDSRYSKGIISYDNADQRFVRTRKPLLLSESDGDSFILVDQEYLERSDLLSMDAYGRPDMAWVIFDNNGILDPTEDLVLGERLRIPPLSTVLKIIG